jgi:hypothetical protein
MLGYTYSQAGDAGVRPSAFRRAPFPHVCALKFMAHEANVSQLLVLKWQLVAGLQH